jgi:ABC-type sugar transport system substrate-binding protein
MAQCLRGAVVAAVVVGTATAASCTDIRVGFINPTGPPAFWNQVNATMTTAASQLGIDVDIRETERSRDKAIASAEEFASRRPALDYLIATNDVDAGSAIIKIADAAHLKLI